MDENNNIKSKLRYAEEKEKEKEKERNNEEAKDIFNKSIDIGKDLTKQLLQTTFGLFKFMCHQCVENWQVK